MASAPSNVNALSAPPNAMPSVQTVPAPPAGVPLSAATTQSLSLSMASCAEESVDDEAPIPSLPIKESVFPISPSFNPADFFPKECSI